MQLHQTGLTASEILTFQTMAVDFARLKRIDPRDRLLIYGYFREYEAILLMQNDNNSYYNMAELSILITLLYYAITYEILEFDPLFKSAKNSIGEQ